MTKGTEMETGLHQMIARLQGPVMVVGAGGFIGVNLLETLLSVRDDVIGVSRDHTGNWRFLACNIPQNRLSGCDITDGNQLRRLLKNFKPQTLFNLAAYGAYSKQAEYGKIYRTNFIASVDLIETAKEYGFKAFVQAGSSSEYGLNAAAPAEDSILTPNSHYAVSKVAVYHAVKYYGKIENLPLIHLRIYSAYGPWEEPDRLIPVLLSAVRKNTWPDLVNSSISRDFIHVKDVVAAFIYAAAQMKPDDYGECFNVGTGMKTSIADLVELLADSFSLSTKPGFGKMPDRKWDLSDWYAQPEKFRNRFHWMHRISLNEGLVKLAQWQQDVDFDHAFWNWTTKK
jgi:polyisoprenyl-phosphate glycosyltransferase